MIFFITVFSYSSVFSTLQCHDILIYNEDTFAIGEDVYPLESFFDNVKNIRPDSIFEKYGYFTSASWRGYIGVWLIENDSLFLLELKGFDEKSMDLSKLFKNTKLKKRIFAEWYNNEVYCYYGNYISQNVGIEIFEHEIYFKFNKGLVTKIKYLDNTKTFISDFTHNELFYFDHLKCELKESYLTKNYGESKKVLIKVINTDNSGKIDSVDVFKGIDKVFNNEAIRIVKSFPSWDVLYLHGERINQYYIISLEFNID